MKKFLKNCKYRIEYIFFTLLTNALASLPIDRASYICAKIATVIGPWLPVTRTARRNLNLAFSNLSHHEEQKILHDLWDNFGRFIGEFPHIHNLTEREAKERIEVIGMENIADFQKKHQPFILCTGHFANWDLALRALEFLYPKWGVIYRKANNPLVNNIINKWRGGKSINLIAKGPDGARKLVKSLKDKDSICMLVDQKMNDGISVPFFGLPAMTASAIAKFALQYNYPIVPVQIIRKDGANIKLIIHKELKIDYKADESSEVIRIMKEINLTLESWVRDNPSQWFWFHNRWGKRL